MPTRRTNNPVHIIVERTDSPQRATPDPYDAFNQALTEHRRAQVIQAINDAQIAVLAQTAPDVWQAYLDTLPPAERHAVEARARRGEHRS